MFALPTASQTTKSMDVSITNNRMCALQELSRELLGQRLHSSSWQSYWSQLTWRVAGIVTWDPFIYGKQVFSLAEQLLAFLPLLQAKQLFFYLFCLGSLNIGVVLKHLKLVRGDAEQIRPHVSHLTPTCTSSVSVLHNLSFVQKKDITLKNKNTFLFVTSYPMAKNS